MENIMAIEIKDENFEELVLKSDKPVMVDFFASWCGPCKILGPIVDELAKDYEETAVIGKMNVESNALTPMKYGIRNIPTILFFKDGEVKDIQVGMVPKNVLAAKIDSLM